MPYDANNPAHAHLNPNKVKIPKRLLSDTDVRESFDFDLIEFYPNARELVINGKRYSLEQEGNHYAPIAKAGE